MKAVVVESPAARRAPCTDGTGGRCSRVLLLALVAGFLVAGVAAGQEVCLDCHEHEIAGGSVHDGFGCADCHSDVDPSDVPHPGGARLGAEICSDCHSDSAEAVVGSVHEGNADCLSCHGAAHEVRGPSDLGATTSPFRQVATCGQCHDTEDPWIEGYISSVHGRALLKSGLVMAPSCSDCHGSHGILESTHPDSQVSREHVPGMCGSCHLGILDEWRDASAHGIGWERGDASTPVCTTCHASHRIDRPTEAVGRLASPDSCGNCHGEEFSTYRDSFHGKVTDLGFVTGAICSDCHTPHQNLAATDPRSSIHPDNLVATCGQCHPSSSASFVTFEPHSDPHDPEGQPAVHWIYVFMTGLLLAVFGGFGLHDLLWLQRSVVGWMRGEFSQEEMPTGRWVRRFSKVHVRTHVVVVCTFLILAATGLPLKFHTAGWAHWFAAIVPGGIGFTRWLHRVAAVLTFGYAIAHATFLTNRALRHRDFGILYGWRSMVPRLEDLRDLWHNLRFFLYLEKRPRFDRFTYWEKFDYFAVFWGVPVIGFSGLMLWFPGFFASFLPGWALNAAFVIHSDEALLATGFIFTFHFFHTHLRPESFPMDPVIFLGKMPLARFEEERPLEYERLVERGELEAWIEEPPTDEEMRKALTFGMIAVVTGLLLVAGIFWGLLLA